MIQPSIVVPKYFCNQGYRFTLNCCSSNEKNFLWKLKPKIIGIIKTSAATILVNCRKESFPNKEKYVNGIQTRNHLVRKQTLNHLYIKTYQFG